MSEDTVVVAPPVNPALTRLIDIPENIDVRDMNYIFHYQRLKKPDQTWSKLFALFYREQQQETWSSCSNLLTDQFTVARTDMVIQQIKENLGGNIQSERHYRSGTSVKGSFTLSGFQIDVVDEPEIDLILFKLVTNLSAELQVITSSNLTFNVINGFSGNHALQLNYGLLKTLVNQTGDKIAPINNVFVLDSFTKRIIHDNRLSISIEDVTRVQLALANRIAEFKGVAFTPLMVNDIELEFPKRFAKRFASLYEMLPENFRNYYYVSYILSSLLDEEKKIALEIKLRTYVANKIRLASRVTV